MNAREQINKLETEINSRKKLIEILSSPSLAQYTTIVCEEGVTIVPDQNNVTELLDILGDECLLHCNQGNAFLQYNEIKVDLTNVENYLHIRLLTIELL